MYIVGHKNENIVIQNKYNSSYAYTQLWKQPSIKK